MFSLSYGSPCSTRSLQAVVLASFVFLVSAPAFAQVAQDSAIGNNNGVFKGVDVGINGDASGANLNNNKNTLVNGGNTVGVSAQNSNVVQPVVISPSQGGTSALVLPRNPLTIPNAVLGRKNFGFQVGLQNNPTLSSVSGASPGLGWFMQAGLNVPFGKIPEPFMSPAAQSQLNDRQHFMDKERNVFGQIAPGSANRGVPGNVGQKSVQGQVLQQGLSAYSPSSITTGKLSGAALNPSAAAAMELPLLQANRPRVLSLGVAKVYSKPLLEGERLALLQPGEEYIYLGHTQSGWVKILLPTGKTGWAQAPFEYIKSDYTELDALTGDFAANPSSAGHSSAKASAAASSALKQKASASEKTLSSSL
jgi:hypothetical protein